jgi:hypothetical protein
MDRSKFPNEPNRSAADPDGWSLAADGAERCPCGHEVDVHDAYGCAAWLGAYACSEAAPRPTGHCGCTLSRTIACRLARWTISATQPDATGEVSSASRS